MEDKNIIGMVWEKPKHQGVNNLKFDKNIQLVAEYKVGLKYNN